MRILVCILSLWAAFIGCHAEGVRLEKFNYPYPVHIFKFASQKQDLEMAYMDVRPANSNADTVLLLHGKNFSGAYWGGTAAALRDAGYRVLIPDQIGFVNLQSQPTINSVFNNSPPTHMSF